MVKEIDVEGEYKNLNGIAEWSNIRQGFNGQLIQYVYQRMRPWFRGSSVLELGCADGSISEQLPKHFEEIVIVDGAQTYIETVQKLLGDQAEYYVGLFEEVEISRTFDTILAVRILEHVVDPRHILQRMVKWLAPGGVVIVSVPNAHSIHRQVGVRMGVLDHVQSLSEADHLHHHRRVYTADALRADIEAVGLHVVEVRGVFLKTLSNEQIESQWSVDLVNAFYEMADAYPGVSTPLIVRAERSNCGGKDV